MGIQNLAERLAVLRLLASLAIAVMVGGCAAPPLLWSVIYKPVEMPKPAYGVDYSYANHDQLYPWLNQVLPVSDLVFVGRYISSESDASSGKLFNPSKERVFIGSKPVLPIAIPISGSNHSFEVGVQAGDRTIDQLVAIVGPDVLKRHLDGIAIFLNVEGQGKKSWETELSESFYTGWASRIKQRGSEMGTPFLPAIYMSANAQRALSSWRALVSVSRKNPDLAPVAIWAVRVRSEEGVCAEVIKDKALEKRWFDFYDSLQAGDIKSRVFGNQFAVNCHRNNDRNDVGFDLTVLSPYYDFSALSKVLLRPYLTAAD